MRVVVQRSKNSSVSINNEIVGQIDYGLVLLVGFTHNDGLKEIEYIVNKIVNLRVFDDETGIMNKSLKEVQGSILSISQFTLYADTKKGRRPSYINALEPEKAIDLYNIFNQKLRENEILVATGVFGAEMMVNIYNDGPVTIIIES